MARIAPETYKPILGFRFGITFSKLPNVGFYGHSSTLPSVENNPQTIEYGNTYIKVKGKTRWNDITITCYAFENITMNEMWNYLNTAHQIIGDGKDKYADQYKGDIQLQLLSPQEEVVTTFKLVGAFIASTNFGQMGWPNEEIVQPELTIAYDYAMFE